VPAIAEGALRSYPYVRHVFESRSDYRRRSQAALLDRTEAGRGCRDDAAGMSVSYVARRHGLSPSLVFRWRQLMSEGGKESGARR